jgi:hypothetical protein
MDRNLWSKSHFVVGHLPQWICPNCHRGWLEFDKNKFKRTETVASKESRKDEYWTPEWIEYIFTGILKCSNKNCRELIAFSGTGEVSQVSENEWDDAFKPEYFAPTLHLFKIPDECPSEIKKEIISAFSLFWIDSQSCANKIRIAIEAILNDQRAKKYSTSKKRTPLNLHQRIESFKTKQPLIASRLLALKWIGNVGSHIGYISKFHLIDAFELLEDSIEKLYDKKEERLAELSKNITKKKGIGYRRKIKTIKM